MVYDKQQEDQVKVCLGCGHRIDLGTRCDKCSKKHAEEEKREHEAWLESEEMQAIAQEHFKN